MHKEKPFFSDTQLSSLCMAFYIITFAAKTDTTHPFKHSRQITSTVKNGFINSRAFPTHGPVDAAKVLEQSSLQIFQTLQKWNLGVIYCRI